MTERAVGIACLVVLCCITFAQAWLSLQNKSLTFDEVAYIPSGYSYVVTGDYRLNPEHPPLMKLLAGLALLPLKPRLDTGHPSWESRDQWAFGRHFFETSDRDVEQLVRVARLPIVLVTVLLVVGAYLFATELYGRRAGMLAAALCAFSPNLLAHGRLVTTDLGHACFVLLSVYTFLRVTRRPTPGRLVVAGIALGLALLTKYTAVLLLGLIPLWALTVFVFRAPTEALDARWLAPISSPRRRGIVLALVATGAVVLVGLLVVTLAYQAPGRVDIYFRNFGVLYSNVHLDRPAYFRGTFHPQGLWYYFAATLLLKVPTAFLILLVIRAGEQLRRREIELETALFVFLPIAMWLSVVSLKGLEYGIRYVLPLLPFLFVYVSGMVTSPWFQTRRLRAIAAILVTWFVGSSLAAFPHYLPYFNEIAGGPANGIEWLDDSNVDWGQDLPLLRDFLTERNITDVLFAPMAWYDPAIYGVNALPVAPSRLVATLSTPDPPPGIYAISAHLLTRSRWNPDALVDPLRDLEPLAVLGYSIYVFDLRR